MNILILEHEIYLQQKIIMRLQDEGHDCINITTVDEANKKDKFDIILISLSYSTNEIDSIIEIYPQTTIIFLGICNESIYKKYISVEKAKDYITKPFSINELIRKVSHYNEFNIIKEKNRILEYYHDFVSKKEQEELSNTQETQDNEEGTVNNFNCILTIDNYIKQVIVSFQNKHSDTELSSRLGINRKTLWVKRNKLNI